MIAPHGGALIDRQLQDEARDAALERARGLLHISVSSVSAADLEMIAVGAYSPLTGFMGRADYESVLQEMRLANGLVWPIPITLPVDDELADKIKIGQEVALVQLNRILAIMEISEKFPYDKEEEARQVYRTTETKHPGVARLLGQGDTLLAGEIWLVNWPEPREFSKLRRTPVQTRQKFVKKEWCRVAGFQTRNPIHRAHEYILKHALEIMDGLFLHPLVGETRPGEISAQARVESYRNLLYCCYPHDRILLGVFPAAMRYAGPREAILHALCRKNYGCSHFIVGHDHAGVGNFYQPTAACDIFQSFSPDEIGIEIILSPEIKYYCRKCRQVVTPRDCRHDQNPTRLSGTEIREMLTRGKMPPKNMMRPEASWVLIKTMLGRKPRRQYVRFVLYLLRNNRQAFVDSLKRKLAGWYGRTSE